MCVRAIRVFTYARGSHTHFELVNVKEWRGQTNTLGACARAAGSETHASAGGHSTIHPIRHPGSRKVRTYARARDFFACSAASYQHTTRVRAGFLPLPCCCMPAVTKRSLIFDPFVCCSARHMSRFRSSFFVELYCCSAHLRLTGQRRLPRATAAHAELAS
jgi:hypothetical protein